MCSARGGVNRLCIDLRPGEGRRTETGMTNNYGIARVLEPKQVLPTSAWKLDNSRYLM